MISLIWTELSAYSIPEIIAVIASLSYTLLAARENRACWPAAFIGSSIYIIVFWQYQLYMDSMLNIYYVAMAVYGWFGWQATASPIGHEKVRPPIIQWQPSTHIKWLLVIVTLTLTSGYYLSHFTDAAFPYLDSLTTWASLLATWMVANKVLENWLYWLVIDFISMLLYINKGLYFTAMLFAFYVVIVIFAYLHWRKLMVQRQFQQQVQQHAQQQLQQQGINQYATINIQAPPKNTP